jgi:Ser/Thr protein kinase RdoA (MazF antagonist)
MLSPSTEAELAEQSRALNERVAASGLYTHEPEEFETAICAYRRLAERLHVASEVRNLATSEGRNIVRLVVMADGSAAVLKVIGNGREPGEGEVLQGWRSRGLSCANPLDWGYDTLSVRGSKRTASFILTGYIEGVPLAHRTSDSLADKEQQLQELLDFIGPFHSSTINVSTARSWLERMQLHLRWTVPLVRTAGLREPEHWREKLSILSDRGRTIIHGDPAGANVLRTPSGLVLLDPPGALMASREADVAQICSQVGGATLASHMIAKACDLDRTLHPEAVACFAGINILVWAGYLLVGHDNPDVAADRSQEKDRQMAEATKYLSVASDLVGCFPVD